MVGGDSFWQSRFALLVTALNKCPTTRVVVADSRAPRDGRIIEEVGRYNPMTAPKTINLDLEKIADWEFKGAQLTYALSPLWSGRQRGREDRDRRQEFKKQLAKEARPLRLPLRPRGRRRRMVPESLRCTARG